MTIKTYFKVVSLCLVVGLFSACADENLANDEKDVAEVKGVKFTTGAPKMQAKLRSVVDDEGKIIPQTSTRTFITHEIGKGADAFWDANDYIWVKDKNNVWRKSIAIELHDGGSSADFTLPGASDDYAEGCEVRYTITPSLLVDEADAAIIPFNQTQSAPNDFSHAGRVGDSGIGKAHDKGNGMFNFELQHLPHYLCFLPRCENASLANNIRLTKIRLDNDNSDGTIEVVGATYLLDQDPFNSVGIDTRYNAIELQSTDGNGFPIAATTADAAADACYMAILPGEHDLILTYTIKDSTTNFEAKITKKVSGTFKAGEITDVTANLNVTRVYTNKYYRWDADEPYDIGHGYESSLPTIPYGMEGATSISSSFLPEDNRTYYGLQPGDDPRLGKGWRPGWKPYVFAETNFFKNNVPNVNEALWYAFKGDPHWDETTPWVLHNHLYTGGMWFKKKSKICADEGITESYMENGFIADQGLAAGHYDTYQDYGSSDVPFDNTAASINTPLTNTTDYFFLPALGIYRLGLDGDNTKVWLSEVGKTGYYWTTSTTTWALSIISFNISKGRARVEFRSGQELGSVLKFQ